VYSNLAFTTKRQQHMVSRLSVEFTVNSVHCRWRSAF